jgi:hypothetical protein
LDSKLGKAEEFMVLKVEEGEERGLVLLTLKGSIDEDTNFGAVPMNESSVIVDLGEVTAINSVGIREWIKWTKTFPEGCHLTVRNCPKIIIDQINMVQGFLPTDTKIESFFVPYYSEASGVEKMVLFMRGREYHNGKISPPAAVKDDGGEVMEMDVIESKYFKFVANG